MNKNCTIFHVSHYGVQFLFFVIEQSLIFHVITKSIKGVKSIIKQKVQSSTKDIGIELNVLETPEIKP